MRHLQNSFRANILKKITANRWGKQWTIIIGFYTNALRKKKQKMSEKTNKQKKNTHNIAVDRFHRMNRLSLRRHFANWIPNSSNILSFKHNSWKYEPHNILCLYLNEADIRASEKISSYSRWVHQICFCSRNFCSLIAEGKTSYKHMFMLYFSPPI